MTSYSDWLIVSDIDGTLLDVKRRLPSQNKQAIKRFVSNGGNFTLCSGRNLQSLGIHYKKLDLKAPAICMNGAGIYDFETDTVLSYTPISVEGEELILDLFNHFKFIQLAVYDLNTIYLYKYTCFYGLVVSALDRLERKLCKRKKDLPTGVWGKATIMATPSTCKKIINFIKNHAKNNLVDCFYTSPVTIEFVCKGVNKGYGVHNLADILNINKNNIGVIGDYYNDEAMLRTASHPACCGQAPDDLKQICEYVTCHCNNGAVNDFINYIEKNYIL
jgi:Cof subfamily protein (haloacid dehalogenase superfamily)